MLLSQFPFTFLPTLKGMAYDYSLADCTFKLVFSATAAESYARVQVGIDVYILHRKYQAKPHSSPWFSAACAAAIAHRNHFFRLYQHNKSFGSKLKFRRLVIVAKGFLKLMLIKQKSLSFPKKPGPREFWRIANSIFNKGKSAVLLLFFPEVLSSKSIW